MAQHLGSGEVVQRVGDAVKTNDFPTNPLLLCFLAEAKDAQNCLHNADRTAEAECLLLGYRLAQESSITSRW